MSSQASSPTITKKRSILGGALKPKASRSKLIKSSTNSSVPLTPTTPKKQKSSGKLVSPSQISSPISVTTTTATTSTQSTPTKLVRVLNGPSANIPSPPSLDNTTNYDIPTYHPSRYIPSLPLPERWNWQHDRAICMMDARDWSLHKIIASLKRSFPELAYARLTEDQIDKRLRMLDQDVSIDYWRMGLEGMGQWSGGDMGEGRDSAGTTRKGSSENESPGGSRINWDLGGKGKGKARGREDSIGQVSVVPLPNMFRAASVRSGAPVRYEYGLDSSLAFRLGHERQHWNAHSIGYGSHMTVAMERRGSEPTT